MVNIENFMLYFCMGMLLIEGLPILEALITLIISFLQMLQGFMAVVAAKQQVTISTIKDKANTSSSSTRQIGFVIDDDNEDEEENENF